jgi:AcrR family transcriptional regulator
LVKWFDENNFEASMAGGRKKEFDKQEALVEAMKVFWKKGYLGASLTDLIQAMGINKPSMYATFGNKEQLFLTVTEHYLTHFAAPSVVHLSDESLTPKQGLKAFLMASIENQCRDDTPRGCFISLCSVEAKGDNLPEQAESCIKKAGEDTLFTLHAFFTKHHLAHHQSNSNAKRHSQTPQDKSLAVFTLLQGTATMAKLGKVPSELEAMVDMLLDGMDI